MRARARRDRIPDRAKGTRERSPRPGAQADEPRGGRTRGASPRAAGGVFCLTDDAGEGNAKTMTASEPVGDRRASTNSSGGCPPAKRPEPIGGDLSGVRGAEVAAPGATKEPREAR